MIKRLKAQSTACPDQTFSLVGYSQGAGVMHAAAKRMPESLYAKIKSVVMFGDPMLKLGREFPEGLREKVLQNCAEGDPVRFDPVPPPFSFLSLTLGRRGMATELT